MEINVKNMKAGYQGKPDAMREMAQRLMNHPGKCPDTIFSSTAADKEKMRPYKEGGRVSTDDDEEGKMKRGMLSTNFHIEKIKKDAAKEKEDDKTEYKKGGAVKSCSKREKFAEGGVAKIRLGQSTMSGKQIPVKKKTGKSPY
jgi:hypothetical protein